MPLKIIKGPPNSGRTEQIRQAYVESLHLNPILVVPSTDAVFTWEERLTRDRSAFLGGRVVHFNDLIDEILGKGQDTASPAPDREATASPILRRSLAASALDQHWPLLAERIGDQPGLLDALLRLIDELRENLIDPGTLDHRIREAAGRVPAELALTYRGWLNRLDETGRSDSPQRAVEAVSAPLAAWEGRPVFVAGFDDLTTQQLTLLRGLSGVTEVTIAITHERENRAMAVTESLLGRLEANGATVSAETSRPDLSPDHDPLLFELVGSLLDREADGTLEAADSLRFLESAGRRGEAEQVGARVARLVADGTSPDEIVIAVESPATNGPIFRDVLASFDLPVTLESETSAPETAVGQAALNLMRAVSPTGTVEDLFAFARGPLGLDQDIVDRIELEVLRQGINRVDEVAGRFRKEPRVEMLSGWDRARAGDATGAVREVAERAARSLVTQANYAGAETLTTETGMSRAIIETCDELDSLQEETAPAELSDILLSDVVKVWSVPVAGAVTIASPYSLRAKRYEHLFICSLQERSLGDDGGGPFLTAAARSALSLPDMTDPEDQDLYLFYSSIAVPTKSLTLSNRSSDVHGKAEFPSPLIGEVKRLFRDPTPMIRRRLASDIVFSTADAPSLDELTRSIAAKGEVPALSDVNLTTVTERLEQAEAVDELTREFGPIRFTDGFSSTFSASALETFIDCPYRWFFERALKPVRFGPEPEAIARGNLIHQVLADLYSRHPGELPEKDSLDEWVAEAARLTIDAAADEEIRLGTGSADHRVERQRVMTEISRFLKRETSRQGDGFHPAHLERSFGMVDPDGGEAPAIAFDGWSLRGRIDRIDIAEDGGQAVVFDYKSGRSSFRSLAQMRTGGKVQLHLYTRAAEGFEGTGQVVAALYLPIFAGDGRPRGILSQTGAHSLARMLPYPKDVPEDFEEEIARGVAVAGTAGAEILEGRIRHRQGECLNHFHHAGVPDWKLSSDDAIEDGR